MTPRARKDDEKSDNKNEGGAKAEGAPGALGEGEGAGTGVNTPSTDPKGRDTRTAGRSSLEAPPNQNAATFGRGEELAAASAMVRGGVTPSPSFPTALPREQQEENLAEAAAVVTRNMTGTDDGVSSVLPVVGGVTNLAMTEAERLANLDDGGVDARGRLAGTYYDDLQLEEEQRRRERIEGYAGSEEASAAAERVRALASSPATSAADLGKPTDEQARVDPKKLTRSRDDDSDPNSHESRSRERVNTERDKPASARA